MNGKRSPWLAVGLVISGFATIVLGAMALGGFAVSAACSIASREPLAGASIPRHGD